jgi:signal peptidase I
LKYMIKCLKILKGLVWTAILLFLALIAITLVPIKGNYKVFTVQSGSMEPAIHLGSLIFVKANSDYNVGDIVTRSTNDPKATVTHRILSKKEENGQTIFETKGDANDSPDGENLSRDKIIGKEFFNIPYVGYPIGYARTTTGFILLVIIPAVIIVYEELRRIKEELVNMFKKKREKKKMLQEEDSFEKRYVRQPKVDNARKVTLETEKEVIVNKKNTGRRMGL